MKHTHHPKHRKPRHRTRFVLHSATFWLNIVVAGLIVVGGHTDRLPNFFDKDDAAVVIAVVNIIRKVVQVPEA